MGLRIKLKLPEYAFCGNRIVTFNILLIEDDPFTASLVETIVKGLSRPSNLTHLVNRVDIDELNIKDFDLMICDLNLPDSTPYATSYYLMQASTHIATVAYSGDEECLEVLREACHGRITCLNKSSSLKELRNLIDSLASSINTSSELAS